MRAWLAALHRTQGWTCIEILGSEYPDESLTTGARHEITVRVTVDLPISFETYTTAKVELTAQTGAVIDPT
jgi:hypothetical protein